MPNTPSNHPDQINPELKSQHPRAKHLPVGLTAKAITHFRNKFFNEGKLTPAQVCEISDILKLAGPQEALKKLGEFLKQLDK